MCLGTLCGGDCDACAVVCVGCEYAERVRGYDGDRNYGVLDGVGVVVVNAVNSGHEYLGGTRGSGSMSSASDVLIMRVVLVMRIVCGVCEMCMYLAWGGVGGEWIRELGFVFINPVETGGVLDVYLRLGCGGGGGGGVGRSDRRAWARVWKGGVVLCLGDL